jgi:phosphoribosylformimino-5-aminoimidazole carboxamide ribotide isomerase
VKIIPAIDLMDGKVVRLIKGNPKNKTIYSNNPVEIAKKWERTGADRIHVVDLDATLGSGSNLSIIKKIKQEISIPIQAAGGLRNKEAISDALSFADKIVVGTFAFENKDNLSEILTIFGKEKFIISVDQLKGKIVINGWRQNTGIELIAGIEDFLKIGLSEFLLTSVDRDGTLLGPDIDSLSKACKIKNAKIIASGGIADVKDTIAVKKCGAEGVILGKALYDGRISIEEVRAIK